MSYDIFKKGKYELWEDKFLDDIRFQSALQNNIWIHSLMQYLPHLNFIICQKELEMWPGTSFSVWWRGAEIDTPVGQWNAIQTNELNWDMICWVVTIFVGHQWSYSCIHSLHVPLMFCLNSNILSIHLLLLLSKT